MRLIPIQTEWRGLAVCHDHEPCKTAEPVVMPFGMLTRVGQRNHVVLSDGDLGPHAKGKYLGGKWRMVKYRERKGKEEYLCSAFCTKVHTKRSGMDHTVLPTNSTMPAFPSWRSPDVTTAATEAADIQLQLTTHLSTPKG